MQGGWGGEGGLVRSSPRMNSGRGGRGPRNQISPRDGGGMSDFENEANIKLNGEEQSSNTPPWVVNLSKVI